MEVHILERLKLIYYFFVYQISKTMSWISQITQNYTNYMHSYKSYKSIPIVKETWPLNFDNNLRKNIF